MKCSLALIPLTLAVWCYADFLRPINISLDEPPKERWAPLMKVINVSNFRIIAPLIIDSVMPERLYPYKKSVEEQLKPYIPQPYAGEIQGLASLSGVDINDIILLNIAYEITPFCTSIVAQDTNGRIYLGRNLDYPFDNVTELQSFVKSMRNVTVDILFIRDGKVAYRGTSFAGYIGLWTGQSANKFTISGNERGNGLQFEKVISDLKKKIKPASWLMRETLEEAANYQDALERLSKVPIITPVYYIIAGVQPGEGAVVTRDPTGAVKVWKLDPPQGQWFLVQTNDDYWKPPPDKDKRRTPTINALNDTGQENITLDSLFKVLSANLTCNRTTVIYTTVMSAGTPEEYRTKVRPECSNSKGIIYPANMSTWAPIVVCLGFLGCRWARD